MNYFDDICTNTRHAPQAYDRHIHAEYFDYFELYYSALHYYSHRLITTPWLFLAHIIFIIYFAPRLCHLFYHYLFYTDIRDFTYFRWLLRVYARVTACLSLGTRAVLFRHCASRTAFHMTAYDGVIMRVTRIVWFRFSEREIEPRQGRAERLHRRRWGDYYSRWDDIATAHFEEMRHAVSMGLRLTKYYAQPAMAQCYAIYDDDAWLLYWNRATESRAMIFSLRPLAAVSQLYIELLSFIKYFQSMSYRNIYYDYFEAARELPIVQKSTM